MEKTTISAIIITKNEEERIADCIDSVSFCNEVIVIDSNSTDRTVAISRQMHAIVYEDGGKDFSKRRNLGKEKAGGVWVLYIDADERVSDELSKSIQQAITSTEADAYILLRKNFYFGNFPWPKIEKIPRLFKKTALLRWEGKLHESPLVEGKTALLPGYLLHYTHRNLSYMLSKTNMWSDTEAKLRIEANHPRMTWWRFPRVMVTAFLGSYIGQSGWRLGTAGLVESMYQSYSMFITYAKLWEMQQKDK